jgi:hypothetical protein
MKIRELIKSADECINKKLEKIYTLRKSLDEHLILNIKSESSMDGEYLGIDFLFSKDTSLNEKLRIIEELETEKSSITEIREVVIYTNIKPDQNSIYVYIEPFTSIKDLDEYNIVESLEINKNLDEGKEININIKFSIGLYIDTIKKYNLVRKLSEKNKPAFSDIYINDFEPDDFLEIVRKLNIIYTWRIKIGINEVF